MAENVEMRTRISEEDGLTAFEVLRGGDVLVGVDMRTEDTSNMQNVAASLWLLYRYLTENKANG